MKFRQSVGYVMLVLSDVLGSVGTWLYMRPHLEECEDCKGDVVDAVEHEAHEMLKMLKQLEEASRWN
jgi:hypothetical protein